MIDFLKKTENFSITNYASNKFTVQHDASKMSYASSRLAGLGVFFLSSIADAAGHTGIGVTIPRADRSLNFSSASFTSQLIARSCKLIQVCCDLRNVLGHKISPPKI
jgi:hypothetical protein